MRRLLIICLLVAVFPATRANAKGYGVDRIAIDARVVGDGTLEVTESITYTFDGSFRYAYRDFRTLQGQSVAEIRVVENGASYRNEPGDSPGTYVVEPASGVTRVKWFYRAHNEQRTFEISYIFHGAVDKYSDVTELYYKFVGDEWDRRIGSVEVTITPPAGLSSTDVRAWAHGPLNGEVHIGAGGSITLAVAPLPARTFWEARVVYPNTAFAALPVKSNVPRLDTILGKERRWAAEANRRREDRLLRQETLRADAERRARLAAKLWPFSIVLGLVAMFVWFRFYTTYGRPHRVTVRTPPGEAPSGHPPAILSYLIYNRNVSGASIVATLLDLADRGYINVTQTTRERRSFFGGIRTESDYRFELTGKSLEDVQPFEYDIVDFLTVECGDGKGFTLSELKQTASRNRSRFRKWFLEWTKAVRAAGKAENFYEPWAVRPMVTNAVIGAIVILTGFLITLATRGPAGAPAMILGFCAAVLTGSLNRRSPEGRRLQIAWGEFKDHLRSIERGLGPVRLDGDQWGRYMGAAIIFGMHKKLLPKLEKVDHGGHAVYPVWFSGGNLGASGDGLASLATGLSSMVTSVSSTMSSASGAGGGASGGGGGGAGGGGGGAG